MIDNIANWLCFIGGALAVLGVFLMIVGVMLFSFDL